MGSLASLNTIVTNNLNPHISSFFFCILLFYLFFEVFFSFIRKVLQKKSPVYPDSKHLHMLSFKRLKPKNPDGFDKFRNMKKVRTTQEIKFEKNEKD